MRVSIIAFLFTLMVFLHSIDLSQSKNNPRQGQRVINNNRDHVGISRRMDRNMRRNPGDRYYGIDPPPENVNNNRQQNHAHPTNPIRQGNQTPPRFQNESPPTSQNGTPPQFQNPPQN